MFGVRCLTLDARKGFGSDRRRPHNCRLSELVSASLIKFLSGRYPDYGIQIGSFTVTTTSEFAVGSKQPDAEIVVSKIAAKSVLVPLVVASALAIGFFASQTFGIRRPDTGQLSVAPMLTRVLPAVVAIQAVGSRKKPLSLADLAEATSAGPKADQALTVGEEMIPANGSGVIVDAIKGILLTNQHVVKTATIVTVRLNDGRTVQGKVLGADIGTDVAVVQVEAKDLVAVPFGNSDALRVGDFVIALGSPYGMETSASMAMVSGVMRSDVAPEIFQDFIQIDAVINPGNSGGPLVNLRGELVGLTAASIGERGETSIAFTIPINMARLIADQILKTGSVRRGAIGFGTEDLTPEILAKMNIPFAKGALINAIVPQSPAAKSGFNEGDIIVSLNKRGVRRSSDYIARVASVPIGTKLQYGVYSGGKVRYASLTVEELDIQPTPVTPPPNLPSLAGVTLGDLLPGAMEYGKLRGARVLSVVAGSAAARLGLAVDDVITSLDTTQVRSPKEAFETATRQSKPFRINLMRRDQPAWVLVDPTAPQTP